MAFKMKGSPMQRNFGISGSVLKQTDDKPIIEDGKMKFRGSHIDVSGGPDTGIVSKPKKRSAKKTATKHGPVKGKIGSEYRKKEYDARGWKYDDTISGYNRDGGKVKTKTKTTTKTKTKGTLPEKAKIPTVGGVGGKLGIIKENPYSQTLRAKGKKSTVEPRVKEKANIKKKTKVGKWLKKTFGKKRNINIGSGKSGLE